MKTDNELTLDDSASEALDRLLEMARAGGFNTSPAMFASNAIRLWHALATGRATIQLCPELAEMAAEIDAAAEAVQH